MCNVGWSKYIITFWITLIQANAFLKFWSKKRDEISFLTVRASIILSSGYKKASATKWFLAFSLSLSCCLFHISVKHTDASLCLVMSGGLFSWATLVLSYSFETRRQMEIFHISSSVSKRSASLLSSSGLVLISLENFISSQNFISERNIERKEKETLIYFIIRPIFTLTNRTMISICCVFLSESSSNKYFTPVGHAMWRQENGWHAALCPLDNTLYWKYFQ